MSELNDVEPTLFDVETDLIAMELSLIDVASKVIVVEGSQIDGVSGLIDVEPLRTGDASAVLVEESRLRDQTRLSGQDAFPDSKPAQWHGDTKLGGSSLKRNDRPREFPVAVTDRDFPIRM